MRAVPSAMVALTRLAEPKTAKFTKTGVHAHRLFRYSLRCIVEKAVQIYTSVAVHLSANVL